MMDDVAKSLANKITRDLVYVVGGGAVLCSAWLAETQAYTIEEAMKDLSSIPSIIFVLLVGIAYVAGFILQEAFSFIPGFSTSISIKGWPTWFKHSLRRPYKCYTGEKLIVENGFTDFDAYRIVSSSTKHEIVTGFFDRTATLKHIGTCIGPCFLVTGIFLCFSQVPCLWPIFISIAGLFLFVLVGRLKTMQEITFLMNLQQNPCPVDKRAALQAPPLEVGKPDG